MEMGDEEKAAELFTRSYELYVREPFGVWTEKQTSVGAVNFITGGGGFLQALVFGYAGLRVRPYHLEFARPGGGMLPPGADSLRLVGLAYLGSDFDLEVTADEVALTCHREGDVELMLDFSGSLTFPFVCDGNIFFRMF